MKFYVLARFCETITTVQNPFRHPRSRELILDFLPKLQFCNRNYDFALFPEFEISRALHSPFLKRNFVPKFKKIIITHMHMQRAL